MSVAEDVAGAALRLVGTRFRLHGRCAAGLDCVGVVALALRGGGFAGVVPTGYALRGGDPDLVARMLDAAELLRVSGISTGDILLMRAGPAQLHMAVRTDAGFVHADAGLRRVVETPGMPAWPVLGCWRLDPARQG